MRLITEMHILYGNAAVFGALSSLDRRLTITLHSDHRKMVVEFKKWVQTKSDHPNGWDHETQIRELQDWVHDR